MCKKLSIFGGRMTSQNNTTDSSTSRNQVHLDRAFPSVKILGLFLSLALVLAIIVILKLLSFDLEIAQEKEKIAAEQLNLNKEREVLETEKKVFAEKVNSKESLLQEIALLQENKKNLGLQINHATETYKKLAKDNDNLTNRKNDNLKTIQLQKETYDDLHAKYLKELDLSKKVHTELNDLNLEKTSLKNSYDTLVAQKTSLEKNMNDLNRECNALHNKKVRLEGELALLERRKLDEQELIATINKERSKIYKLSESFTQNSDDLLKKTDNFITNMQSHLDSLKKLAVLNSTLQDANSKFNQEIKNSSDKIASSATQLDTNANKLNAVMTQLDANSQKINTINTQLTASTKALTEQIEANKMVFNTFYDIYKLQEIITKLDTKVNAMNTNLVSQDLTEVRDLLGELMTILKNKEGKTN